MSLVKTITIVCDSNGAFCEHDITVVGNNVRSASSLREAAKQKGWKYDKKSKEDTCSQCKEK